MTSPSANFCQLAPTSQATSSHLPPSLTITAALSVQLTISAASERRALPTIHRTILAAHKLLGSPLTELSIAIVRAKKMASLHKTWLKQPGATDVLTFELEHDRRGRVVSGEIVICSAVARQNARKMGHSVTDELVLYALHGLLHLCGFDDRTAAAFAAMHAKEDEILSRLGIGPVFSGSVRGELNSRRGLRTAPSPVLPRRTGRGGKRGIRGGDNTGDGAK
jgi:probable rRNA maturation factor